MFLLDVQWDKYSNCCIDLILYISAGVAFPDNMVARLHYKHVTDNNEINDFHLIAVTVIWGLQGVRYLGYEIL